MQQSLTIARHVDLFLWLQGGVRQCLPHDVMIAAWGDFAARQLHYDVVSSIPEVRTQYLMNARENIDILMESLYRQWCAQDERWLVLNRFSSLIDGGSDSACFLDRLQNMRSLLVYGIRDLRGQHDSLYVFFDAAEEFPLQRLALEMLMPHIDATLRRIESLPVPGTESVDVVDSMLALLSERERQILRWVKLGKSNYEIALILEISPNTVKHHLKKVFDKLGVSSRLQALNRCGDEV